MIRTQPISLLKLFLLYLTSESCCQMIFLFTNKFSTVLQFLSAIPKKIPENSPKNSQENSRIPKKFPRFWKFQILPWSPDFFTECLDFLFVSLFRTSAATPLISSFVTSSNISVIAFRRAKVISSRISALVGSLLWSGLVSSSESL